MPSGSSLIELRPVTANDATFLTEVANNPVLMEVLCDHPTSTDVWVEAVDAWSDDPDEQCFIVLRVEDGTPIGWVGLNGLASELNEAWIKMIVILPNYWSAGYGGATIQLLKEWCAEQGIASLRLWTDECNARARRCYEREGFVVVRSKRSPVGLRQVTRARVCMECDLDSLAH